MAETNLHLKRRHIEPIAIERMREDPVLLLEGPRAVGKSTLLEQLRSAANGRLLDLDNPATQAAVADDPMTFVTGKGPLFIDEYQKVPQVLDAIKAELNRDSRPGRFVLTGSTRHEALPRTAQALTGRLTRLRIDPLSQSELRISGADLLSTLMTEGISTLLTRTPSTTTRLQYVTAMIAGGFPIANARPSTASRNRWFDEYIKLTLAKDLQELAQIRQEHLLPPLLNILAAQTAGILNVENVARSLGSDPRTILRYVDLLENVFLTYRLPAWGRTISARTTKAPKVHITDAGVAARLMRLSASTLATPEPSSQTELGHLVESFVVGELLKSTQLMDGMVISGHWRTRDVDEVDLIVERDDGAIVAFEVKSSGQVSAKDTKALRLLHDMVGPRLLAGVVMYMGEHTYRLGGTAPLIATPIDSLWKV